MNSLLKPITENEFINLVEIRFNNIDNGFLNFTNGILELADNPKNVHTKENIDINKEYINEDIINKNINESKSIIKEERNYNLEYIKENFKSKETKFISFIKNVYNINKNKPIIVDFYIKKLDSEAITTLLQLLDENDKTILLNHIENIKEDTVYFELCEELIDFIVKLSTREIFFTTIYFLDTPLTIWGNYNMKFPLFFKNEKDIKTYKEIAKECGLQINGVIKI